MNDLSTATENRKVCKKYVVGDSCYSVMIFNQIYRGCLSDDDAGSNVCLQSGKCQQCLVRNCNTAPAQKAASLSCVKCKGADKESDCSWGYDTEVAEVCVNSVLLGDFESCYRKQDENGVVQRGCSLDEVAVCQGNNADCETCSSAACNRNTYNKHKCYQCHSSVEGQESCAEEVEGLEALECRGEDHKATDGDCYMLKKEDGSWVRGCLRDTEKVTQDTCKVVDNEQKCTVCQGEGCNNEKASATLAKALPFAVLLIVAAVSSLNL